uniref:Uncharacterized protein n=1 Tax=Cucumis sativus TaxID=3659 RepID=A0A0A0KKS9_CUCSA
MPQNHCIPGNQISNHQPVENSTCNRHSVAFAIHVNQSGVDKYAKLHRSTVHKTMNRSSFIQPCRPTTSTKNIHHCCIVPSDSHIHHIPKQLHCTARIPTSQVLTNHQIPRYNISLRHYIEHVMRSIQIANSCISSNN